MTDNAPDRIWSNGLGVYGEYAGFGGTEYVRADLCDPMQDERVKALVEAVKSWDEYDKDTDFGTQMIVKYNHALRLTHAALRDMGVE
jgi:hypothetical protein